MGFRDPLLTGVLEGDASHLSARGPMVCFDSMHVHRALAASPDEARAVSPHLEAGVRVIDHTTSTNLSHFAEEFERGGRGRFEIRGLERMRMGSEHPACLRIGRGVGSLVVPEGSKTVPAAEWIARVNPGALEDDRPAEEIDA